MEPRGGDSPNQNDLNQRSMKSWRRHADLTRDAKGKNVKAKAPVCTPGWESHKETQGGRCSKARMGLGRGSMTH